MSSRPRRWLAVVAQVACACVLVLAGPAAASSEPATVRAPVVQAALAPAEVSAAGAVLWDVEDGRALWGREADVARPMASTTKVMTVLLAVEAGTLDEVVTVGAQAARIGSVPGGATMGLREGQRLPMRELLAGLMLRSGNDAAVAVAEHVAGSEPAFVGLMNARATELGLDDTRFLNASGLTDDPRHAASPRDLARLAVVALEHEPIARWAATATMDSPTFGRIENRNELVGEYPGANGVKTGFTSLAGLCLVASAERDGRRLVSVVLGSDDHFGDSALLLDHGFDDWTRLVVDERTVLGVIRTSAGTATAVAGTPLAQTVPVSAEVDVVTAPAPFAAREVAAGEQVGTAQVSVDGRVVHRTAVVAAEPVAGGAPAGVGDALEDGLRGLARLGAPATATSIE